MDIRAWLRSLGLEQYEPAFRDNAINAEVLPRLTAEDLKELGVAPVGHRRMLLDAIGALSRKTHRRPSDPTLVPNPSPAVQLDPQRRPERRHLTVLFSDLVGSTELAARVDPEDFREILHAYHRACAEAIDRFEGFVAKFLGDGVLAYFGYPQAHEDQAGRAVRAGLALVEGVGGLTLPSGVGPLQARVGIATGLVVVGDLIGVGSAQEHSVAGETPNLAARLQAMSPPGSVVLAPGTRRLVGREFEVADLGEQSLKGFAEPVRAWQVLAEHPVESRFEAREARLTPLVGRERETALLFDRWHEARDGEGQAVLLSGESGIGKSRITQAVMERVEPELHIRLRYQCSPSSTNTAFHPFIEQLERTAGFARDDTAQVKLDKLEALLARGTERVNETAPLVAEILSIPSDGRYPPLAYSPQKQKERTIDALVQQLLGLARQQPVLCIFEDMQWADPTTLEVLDRILDRISASRILLIITFRPTFAPPWKSRLHTTHLSLNRLSRRQSADLVQKVTNGKHLPREVLEQILAKTDGMPLFVEELTKTVLEAGFLRAEGDSYSVNGPVPPLAIPTTLQDSLMARLDRLGPAREVAQIGAVIGREFSRELIVILAPGHEDQLDIALERLAEAELVFRSGDPPDTSYVFKHALVRDTAYESLLKARRRQLHGRIVHILEERFPDVAQGQPEMLARHCAEAGLTEKAVAYWSEAGRLALRRSTMAESVAHFSTALELLERQAAGPDRDAIEAELQLALGGALDAAKGWASPEMGRAYARACQLCRHIEGDQLPTALYGLWRFHHNRGDIKAGLDVAEQLLRVAAGQNNLAVELLARQSLGTSLMFRGNLDGAASHLASVRTAHDRRKHVLPMVLPDMGVLSSIFLAWTLQLQGHPERAVALHAEAATVTAELAQPLMSARTLHVACVFHQLRCECVLVKERSDRLIALATEQGFPHFVGTGTFFRGWAAAAAGAIEAGISEMRRGLAAKRATGADIKVPYYLGLLASAASAVGRREEALALFADALETVGTTGERWFEAELHRLRGEALLRTAAPDVTGAENCFRKAIELGRKQGAKWWELRAVTSLATLLADRGERQKAHDLLGPVYAWFIEGSETPDLRQTKALLDALT